MFDSTGWILNEDLEEKDNYDSLVIYSKYYIFSILNILNII